MKLQACGVGDLLMKMRKCDLEDSWFNPSSIRSMNSEDPDSCAISEVDISCLVNSNDNLNTEEKDF
jgi:hypothetical protein